jgi:hypothetical protein
MDKRLEVMCGKKRRAGGQRTGLRDVEMPAKRLLIDRFHLPDLLKRQLKWFAGKNGKYRHLTAI